MAGAEGTVIFQRGVNEEECDSDVWDDTALIEAYDAAVAPLKAKLAKHTGDTSLLENSNRAAESAFGKKKKNRKKKNKRVKKEQVSGWAVDDLCQAVYTEDGDIYEAKIVSIDSENNTCVVRYLGYGNEEEQQLDDLMPSQGSAYKQRRSDSITVSETDSVASRPSTSDQKPGKKSRPSSSSWAWPTFPGYGHSSHHLPHQPPPPPPPVFAAMPGFPPGSVPKPPVFGSAASMPFPMMPPPPPPMPDNDVGDENEALCSMLLSWYMSGYHTGYYQGLKQARQHDGAAATGPAR